MELTEKTVASEQVYQGVIVNVRLDQAELVNGRVVKREVVEHPGGVCVLPLHEDGTVTVVRQFRYPFQTVLTELPAGKLERGEDHRLCGLRELEEEVGLVPERFDYLGCLYTSPGFSDEVLHMYLARDLRPAPAHPDEDEFLEIGRLPLEELADQVMRGAIADAKTAALVLKVQAWLARPCEEGVADG